jgi:hypothetical protein
MAPPPASPPAAAPPVPSQVEPVAEATPHDSPRGKIDLSTPHDPPRGKIDLSTPPPAVSAPRSYHTHDGFYLRASVGFGTLHATFDDDSPRGESLKGSGAGFGFDLMIGGSPAPGVAIGGALMGEGSASIEFERGSFSAEDRGVTAGMLGAFIDGFPSANKGWHLGGMLGLARLTVEDTSSDGLSETAGLGGAFWVGHDFWVGDEWSVGPLLRFSGALTKGSDPDVNASTFAATLMFTGLYH